MEQPNGTSPATLTLQTREVRLLARVRDLLEAMGPMSADRIAVRLKEKHILVLSLLDKAKAAGELYCDKQGRFALNLEQCVEETEQQTVSSETEPEANAESRLLQARTFLKLWRILKADSRLTVTVGKSVDACRSGVLVARVRVEESAIPMVELWEPSRSSDSGQQRTQVFRIWNKPQATVAIKALKERLGNL
ncbi:MAG TPA: hypothetical protein PKH07_20045 [bacterium]|nr:hypothetical protein [bacterium]